MMVRLMLIRAHAYADLVALHVLYHYGVLMGLLWTL